MGTQILTSWLFWILVIVIALVVDISRYFDFALFFRWLKGSRLTYYIDERGFVRSTTKKLRTPADRVGTNMKPINQGVIEINQGWFRFSGAIYGDFHIGPWKITKTSKGCNAQGGFGANWVELVDRNSLPVERALHLINSYSSLQHMLSQISELERHITQVKDQNKILLDRIQAKNGRIAELEQELIVANDRRQDWLAAVGALSLEITNDRQRYRSPAASHIRECVEAIINWAEQERKQAERDRKLVPWIDPNKVMAWKKRFPVHVNEENFISK